MIPTASGDGVAALYNASLDDVALRTGTAHAGAGAEGEAPGGPPRFPTRSW